MSDLTVKAEALISAVARAFYEDEAICLIDVLLRDKYLRDDDMGPRLSLQPKQLRRVLQFLQEEHMVKFEEVDDLAQGGSQQTKFWYIDYNQAVHTIRLRIFLLKQKLEQAELAARSSSFYLCPGYQTKRCNGRYSEEQAQTEVDPVSGLFLCQECVMAYESSVDPPDKATYTLQLVDNAQALKRAVDDMRRVHVQLSGKMMATEHLRPSIYDLLQKVRVKGKGPLTSNLPSENFSLGIGSKRLAGTGRTAGIKAKKRAQLNPNTNDMMMMNSNGTLTRMDDSEIFLKNAMGQELQLTVEKGGGARAQLLATNKRRKRKLMDAAASRVGAALPAHIQLYLVRQRAATIKKQAQASLSSSSTAAAAAAAATSAATATTTTTTINAASTGAAGTSTPTTTAAAAGGAGITDGKTTATSSVALIQEEPSGLAFLHDNIGRPKRTRVQMKDHDDLDDTESSGGGADNDGTSAGVDGVVLMDETLESLLTMDEDERKAAFQAQYKMEMGRQAKLLHLDGGGPPKLADEDIMWEDG
jgi:transcription initiation factor IIE alpha subunit